MENTGNKAWKFSPIVQISQKDNSEKVITHKYNLFH